ncbi:MAG: hypothetical protein VB031_05720 [Eubacteriaceae bacterium]|nr:hypothetical protein [Eubacteriaceae bacterium]
MDRIKISFKNVDGTFEDKKVYEFLEMLGPNVARYLAGAYTVCNCVKAIDENGSQCTLDLLTLRYIAKKYKINTEDDLIELLSKYNGQLTEEPSGDGVLDLEFGSDGSDRGKELYDCLASLSAYDRREKIANTLKKFWLITKDMEYVQMQADDLLFGLASVYKSAKNPNWTHTIMDII